MDNAESKGEPGEPVIDAPPVLKPWRTPHIVRSSAKSTDQGAGFDIDASAGYNHS